MAIKARPGYPSLTNPGLTLRSRRGLGMFLKSFGILAPVAAAGLYVWSGLAGAYTREVERPPAAVIAALADLDVSLQAGSPGQDPSRPGAARPQIRRDYTKEGMVWTVMSGDKVATRLWATVEAARRRPAQPRHHLCRARRRPRRSRRPRLPLRRRSLAACSRRRSKAGSTDWSRRRPPQQPRPASRRSPPAADPCSREGGNPALVSGPYSAILPAGEHGRMIGRR